MSPEDMSRHRAHWLLCRNILLPKLIMSPVSFNDIPGSVELKDKFLIRFTVVAMPLALILTSDTATFMLLPTIVNLAR